MSWGSRALDGAAQGLQHVTGGQYGLNGIQRVPRQDSRQVFAVKGIKPGFGNWLGYARRGRLDRESGWLLKFLSQLYPN